MKEEEKLISLGKVIINEMPAKEVLEEFLQGMSSSPTVIFNLEKGRFEKIRGEGEGQKS